MASNNCQKSDIFSNEKSGKEKASNDTKTQALSRLRSMEWMRNQSDKWHMAGSFSKNEKGQGDCDVRSKATDYHSGTSGRVDRTKTHQVRKKVTERVFFPQKEPQSVGPPKENAWQKKKGADLFLRPEDQEERVVLKQVLAESLRTAEEDKRRAEERKRNNDLESKWEVNFTLPGKELTFIETVTSDESSEAEEENSPTLVRGRPSDKKYFYGTKTHNKKHEKDSENNVLKVVHLATNIASLNISKELRKTEVKDNVQRAKKVKPEIQTNGIEPTKLPMVDEEDDMFVEQYLRFETSPQMYNSESDLNVLATENIPPPQNQSEFHQAQVLSTLNHLISTVPKNSPDFEILMHSLNQVLMQRGLQSNQYQNSTPNLQYPPYSVPAMYTQVNPSLPYVPTSPNVPIAPQFVHPYTSGYLPQYSYQDVIQQFYQQNQLLIPQLQNQPGNVPDVRLPETLTNTIQNNNSPLAYSYPDTPNSLTPLLQNQPGIVPNQIESNVPVYNNGSEENLSRPSLSQPQGCLNNPGVQSNQNRDLITYLMQQTDRLLKENTERIAMTTAQIHSARLLRQPHINSTGQVIQDQLNSATQVGSQTQLYSPDYVMPVCQVPQAMAQPLPVSFNYPPGLALGRGRGRISSFHNPPST